MDITSKYSPTSKQMLYHTSDADEILYGGAAGGGKSRATVEDALDTCMKYKGVDVYLFRKTYPELKDTLIKEAQLIIPNELGAYNQQFHDYTLINGSKMHFRYCRNMIDAFRYQGTEMHRLYIDELTHFTKEQYDYLKTRVRIPKNIAALGIKPKTKSTTNPGGVGHGWAKEYFITLGDPFKIHKKEIKSEVLNKSKTVKIQYIPAYATDNPHLTEDYIFELEQKPEALRKSLLLGLWDAFEGQVFVEWRDNPEGYESRKWTHVINEFEVPKGWKRFRTFDWGYSKPFSVAWWAMDYEGRLYRYRELYGCTREPNVGVKWYPDKVASEVKSIETNLEPKGVYIHGIADPAIFDASTGESIAQTFEKHGVYFDKADNSRIPGKMQFHYRLAFDAEGYPMTYIFKNCKGFIRTIPSLVYSMTKVEDIDTSTEDHVYDESRYLYMSNPLAPRKNMLNTNIQYNPLETYEKLSPGIGFLRS